MSKEAKKQETQGSRLEEPRPLVVQGTGNPTIDVPAVQAAIDNASEDGRTVYLKRRFSFGSSAVTIRNWARVRGLDELGEREKPAIIEGGQNPLIVDSGEQPVSITGVHFKQPIGSAIRIRSVNGLTISNCWIDTPVPVPAPSMQGVQAFNTSNGIFGASNVQGVVKEIAGQISIVGNVMDITDPATITNDPTARTVGIQFNLTGQTMKAHITISGKNVVNNVTAHGVALRDIVGTATIQDNFITTGKHGARLVGTSGPVDSFVDGIMCQGAGLYTVTGNTIDSGYENSAGIRLQSRSSMVPVKEASIDGNTITMSAPSGSSHGTESAGVELRRNCTENTVSGNTIIGEARAALAVITDLNLSPSYTKFRQNRHPAFTSTMADIIVDLGVQVTTIEDGTGGTICRHDQVNTTVTPGNYVDVC